MVVVFETLADVCASEAVQRAIKAEATIMFKRSSDDIEKATNPEATPDSNDDSTILISVSRLLPCPESPDAF